jgi:hypothetical protein
VPGEEELVRAEGLVADDPRRVRLLDTVHEEERLAVGKKLLDLVHVWNS